MMIISHMLVSRSNVKVVWLYARSADDWFDCHQLKVVVVADLLFRISPKNNSDWKGQAGDDCRETN